MRLHRLNRYAFLPLALLCASPLLAQDDGHGHNDISTQVQSRVYSSQIESLSTPRLVDALAASPFPGSMVQAAARIGAWHRSSGPPSCSTPTAR